PSLSNKTSLPLHLTFFPYTTLFRSTDGKLCDQEVTTRIGKRTEWNQIEHPIGCDAHAVHLWFALTNETISGLSFCERVRKASREDRKSTRLNSSHQIISYAVFCLKK